jgi:urea transporter
MAEHWLAWPAVALALVGVVLAGARARRTDASERSVAAIVAGFSTLLVGYLGLVAVTGRVL